MPRLLPICIALTALLLSACQTAPPAPDQSQETDARERIDAGDYRAAGTEFERLANEKRGLRDYYRLRAAEAWREEAELDAVARLLGEIKRKNLDAGQNLRFDLLAAEIALSQQQAARASALLAVDDARIPATVRERWLELQARAFAAEGRYLPAARTRLRLIAVLPESERRDAQRELLEMITVQKPEVLRTDLLALAADDAARPWLEQALRVTGEPPARAPIAATEAVGTMMAGSDGRMRREGFKPVRKLALLLPVHGDYAAAGRAILDGVMSMHYQLAAASSLQVYDAGSTRRSALDAYQLALNDGVDAVLGPVERDQVDAVLEASDGRVPLLTLNYPEPKTIATESSFHFGLLPEEEAALAAERLVAEGATRIAVFGTNEDWSERAMATLDAQLRALGGSISGRRMLRDSDVDFAESLVALIGAPGNAPETRKADGIFLALRPSTARLLMPQLRAADFLNLPIVATSHVYSGAVQALQDKDLDGLVFMDAPWTHAAAVGLPARGELARDLTSAANSPRLFAFGLDAYQLLPYLDFLRAKPGRYIDGASGLLLSDAFGRIRRLPQFYRFVDGVPQPATALRLVAEPASTP
ncbi:MAG TPA: penicillin-binding protein activator [Pseudomonadota bacterium]|nr:penicillin-binding protein activator [Rhodanobacteraceae bacterium]MBP9155071.1 penicillin-binding protein activator [Xanthomonadales bacterium]HQW81350.1 penicillin-binding protein activator [Pseudomonadota bacterium]